MPAAALQIRNSLSPASSAVPAIGQAAGILRHERRDAALRRPHLRLAAPADTTGVDRQDHDASADRAVIHLSLADTRRSLRPHTIGSDIMRAIFGVRPANGFADPRLEALRVYAVTYRTGRGSDDAANIAAAVAAGLEPAILKEARRIIDARAARRERQPRHTMQLATVMLVAVAAILGQHWLAQELDDQLVAWILVAVVAAVVLSWVGRSPRAGH